SSLGDRTHRLVWEQARAVPARGGPRALHGRFGAKQAGGVIEHGYFVIVDAVLRVPRPYLSSLEYVMGELLFTRAVEHGSYIGILRVRSCAHHVVRAALDPPRSRARAKAIRRVAAAERMR